MITNRDTAICHGYAEAAFRRVVDPLPPSDFKPNWQDHPSHYKMYENAERFALPMDFPEELISLSQLAEWIATLHEWERIGLQTEFSLHDLATMLYFAHGTLSRRMRIRPDVNTRMLASYAGSDFYARGTASGGGLYPTEIYWACGAGQQVSPGVYHYDNAHHTMERLLTGDVTRTIQFAAFEHPATLATNQFLMISVNFWKNAFKYNNFSYHVVTQDLGALLGSLWFLATGLRIEWEPIFWYRDHVLNDLLGFDPEQESVFALIPLPSATAPSAPPSLSPTASAVQATEQKSSRSGYIHKRAYQRSQYVFTFDFVARAHQSAFIVNEACPGRQKVVSADLPCPSSREELLYLPAPMIEQLDADLLLTFQQRHSSFGSFSSLPALSQRELATLLAFSTTMHGYSSDIKADMNAIHFTRLLVFINNVEGIERGAYAYEAQTHSLQTICQADMGIFLQEHYFLNNYNLAETGAVIAIVGDVENMLAIYGNRGYRLLNMEAGLMAQSLYMASTGLSLACGAALGFDNVAINEALQLDKCGQKSLLFVFVGHEHAGIGDIDYRLV